MNVFKSIFVIDPPLSDVNNVVQDIVHLNGVAQVVTLLMLVNDAISIFMTLAQELHITYKLTQSVNIHSGQLATFNVVSISVAKTYLIISQLSFEVIYKIQLSITHC
jgi:hypothetical protein